MYQIRVRTDAKTIDATLSGRLSATEVLRSISQGFALAEAGGLTRALCDVRKVEAGPGAEALAAVSATLRRLVQPGQRVALLCDSTQVPVMRRFLRGGGEELGLFTTERAAREWLAGTAETRLSITALRHLEPAQPREDAAPEPGERRTA